MANNQKYLIRKVDMHRMNVCDPAFGKAKLGNKLRIAHGRVDGDGTSPYPITVKGLLPGDIVVAYPTSNKTLTAFIAVATTDAINISYTGTGNDDVAYIAFPTGDTKVDSGSVE